MFSDFQSPPGGILNVDRGTHRVGLGPGQVLSQKFDGVISREG